MTASRVPAALERALNWSTGLVSALALFTIMWLTFVDVMGRKFLSHSVRGGLEITEILMVTVIFSALPLVSVRGEHVVFDSLDRTLPRALRRIQSRLVHLVCGGTFVFLAWTLTLRAQRFAEYGETTVQLRLPMAPVAWTMAALMVLTALVHLVFVFLPPQQGPGESAAPAESPG